MISSQEIGESYKRLRAAVDDLLGEQKRELGVWQEATYPLLVLETLCDSVGFALVNGEPQPAFSSAYDSFKHLYRQRHAAWKERNLSFVVCRAQPSAIHDAFFSSIETDVYFCRKYVISLPRTKDELVRELQRLPFLPLPEGRAGGIWRPPPAQTLLQSLNLNVQLARQITVPLEYSAKRIVDQLLSGKEVLPIINSSAVLDIQQQVQPTERTRIRTVTVNAFRAYRKQQQFDVDADLIVLYGPNGLGKTSFFDALDYVCTGRIGRLCRRRISPEDFMHLARHLGSEANEGYVSLEVSRDAEMFLVTRSVANWGTALVDGERFDRANLLQFLTSSQWGPNRARIENLERLFRATHLFSQTDPELLVEFEQDSALSPDLVHRMLALDDYASSLNKSSAVLEDVHERIRENERAMERLKVEKDEVRSKLDNLPEVESAVKAGKQLRDQTAELIKDLRTHINQTIADTEPNQTSAREWRAITESAMRGERDRLRRIEKIESAFQQFLENRSTLKKITDEITRLEPALKKNTANFKDQQEARKKTEANIEQQRRILTQANSRLRALSELTSLRHLFEKTDNSLRQWHLELTRVTTEIDSNTAELNKLRGKAESLHAQIFDQREAVESKTVQVRALVTIQGGLHSWEKGCANISALQKATALVLSIIQGADVTLDNLRTAISSKQEELWSCEQEYTDLTESQDRLTGLLDELEAHVENGICPACGIDHKTKDALVEKIRFQKQARPPRVEVLVTRCTQLRKAIEQDEASLLSVAKEHDFNSSKLHEMSSKLEEEGELVTAFENMVADAGLVLDQHLAATVNDRLINEKRAIQLLADVLATLEAELTSTTKRINAVEQQLTQLSEAQNRASTAIAPLEQQIAAINAKASASGLSLSMTAEELATESESSAAHKAEAEKRIQECSAQFETTIQMLNDIERQNNEQRQNIEDLAQQKKRMEETLSQYDEDASELFNTKSLSIDVISEQKKKCMERVEILDSLTRRCITFELTLDAVQRSAMLAEFEAKARSIEDKNHILVKTAERMATVRKWFAAVKDTLDKYASQAVSRHVDALGPLTSLIQKRLRAVYGFGDISLLAKGNEIHVVVGWGTSRVKPADYFSDSQKQILMLSLFLAGRLTQTWSGFAPILMDDPVTHFDDLNAFGFVELIRGLLSTSPGKRQFFISTCEERLFDLMLKKFYSIEGGARFYRFEGIGPDGPVITSVVSKALS
jgi:exonuclease SbcC